MKRKLAETIAGTVVADEKEENVTSILDKKLEPLKTRGVNMAWGKKGKNAIVNYPLSGDFTLYFYSAFSTNRFSRWAKNPHYNQDGVEGVVLMPNWYNPQKHEYPGTSKAAEGLADYVLKKAKSIKDTVNKQLDEFSSKYAKIPSSVRAKIVSDMEKLAMRRFGANMLRMKPLLYPFDGSKPQKLD